MINSRTASQFHRTLRMKLKKSLKESLNTASTIIILLFFNLLILRVVVAQSCLTLCVPMDCSLQGSSVLGIFQARVLEWVAIFFSKRSPQPRDRTQVCHIAGRCFTVWATREATILRVAGTLTIHCCSFHREVWKTSAQIFNVWIFWEDWYNEELKQVADNSVSFKTELGEQNIPKLP